MSSQQEIFVDRYPMVDAGSSAAETAGSSSASDAGPVAIVRRVGDKPAFVYLHGLLGAPADAPFLLAAAERGVALAAPCLPGFTGSSPLTTTRSMADWVFHLSALLDQAGLTGLPVVASSVGAMVAAELAAVRPEAFEHLVLVAPLGLWDDACPVADPFATTLSQQRSLLSAERAATDRFFVDPTELAGELLVEHGIERYLTRTAAASLVWPLPDHGLANRIHRVTAPTTLVWGDADQVADPCYSDLWARHLPNVTGQHRIADAGHLVDWDQPHQVLDVVAAALS